MGKGEQNCRQLAARARQHVEAPRPRFTVDRRAREELFDRFLLACETGDLDRLTVMSRIPSVAISCVSAGTQSASIPSPVTACGAAIIRDAVNC